MLYSVPETLGTSTMEQSSTILIADDHPLFREAMRDVVAEAFPEIRTLEANSYQVVEDLVESDETIELILLDLKMPGMNGFSGFVSLRNAVPAIPIVVITADQDPATVRELAARGAAGFMSKSLSRRTMVDALHCVASGDLFFTETGATEDVGPSGGTGNIDEELEQKICSLTQQQRKVLEFVASGLANKVIAYELGITESTVKAHVSAVLRKLNVHSRTQLALIVNKVH